MSEISILDLQNLRHLIGGYETSHCKMNDYAAAGKGPGSKKTFSGCGKLRNEKQTGSFKIFVGGRTMLDDKTMVADALAGVNGELVRYGEMIPQTENKELKQCLKQLRNECEMSQEKLYQIAREKSYYIPAAKATQQEIDPCTFRTDRRRYEVGLAWEKNEIFPFFSFTYFSDYDIIFPSVNSFLLISFKLIRFFLVS